MKYLITYSLTALALVTTIVLMASCSPRNQPCSAYDIDYTAEQTDNENPFAILETL